MISLLINARMIPAPAQQQYAAEHLQTQRQINGAASCPADARVFTALPVIIFILVYYDPTCIVATF